MKFPKVYHSIDTLFLLFIALILFCAVPQDPSAPKNTKITPVVKNMYNITEEKVGSDSLGNTLSIGAALHLSKNIDSVFLEIKSDDETVFDTMFRDIEHSESTDTIWKQYLFLTAGTKTATFTPYSSLDLSPVTATIVILPNPELPENHPPVLTITGDTIIRPGETAVIGVTAEDSDQHQHLVVTLISGPDGASFENDTFSWTPPHDFTSIQQLLFTATDNGFPPKADSEYVELVVTATPNLPTLLISGTQVVKPQETCSLSITISDADEGQSHTVTMSGNPDGAEIEGDSLFIWAVPEETVEGEYTLTLIVSDDGTPSLSASVDIVITVSEEGTTENYPPRWSTDTLPVSIDDDTTYSFTLNTICSDANGDEITFTLLAGDPENDSIREGEYRFIGTVETNGTYNAYIVATDPEEMTDTLVIRLIVSISETVVAPEIISAPGDTTVTAGVDLQFSVTCSGTSPMIQWRKNGEAIEGENELSLSMNSVDADDAGEYSIIVWNSIDSAISESYTLTVLPDAASGVEAHALSATSIKVSWEATTGATGYNVLRAQTGNDLESITTISTFSLVDTPLTEGTTYSYRIVAENSSGSSDTSSTVSATTWSGPSITDQPENQDLIAGDDLQLSVTANGNPALSYQWYKNDSPITSGTQRTFSRSDITESDAGRYYVMVTNSVRSVPSDEATITVLATYALTINVNPGSSGSVSRDPDQSQYIDGTAVQLTADPASGYRFDSWSGDASGASTTTTVSMDENKNVVANFIRQYTLTVTAANNGSVDPNGTITVDQSTATIITATPDAGFVFDGWSVTSGSADITDVSSDSTTMQLNNENATVHALFKGCTFDDVISLSGSSNNIAVDVIQADDTSYIVAVEASNGSGTAVVKLNTSGQIIWEKQFSTPVDPQVIVKRGSSGYGIVGTLNNNIYMSMIASNGNFFDDNSYGGTEEENGVAGIPTSDGGLALFGSEMSSGAYFLVKTDIYGDTAWTRYYSNGYELRDGAQTADGGYIMTGHQLGVQNHLIKTNSSGTNEWDTIIQPTDGSMWLVLQSVYGSDDGGFIAVGRDDDSPFNAVVRAFVIKFSSTGSVSWYRKYDDAIDPKSVKQTRDGGYIFVADTKTLGPGGNDIYLVKLDGGGNITGYYIAGHPHYDEFCNAVIETDDNGYLIVGYTNRTENDIYAVKINSTDLLSP